LFFQFRFLLQLKFIFDGSRAACLQALFCRAVFMEASALLCQKGCPETVSHSDDGMVFGSFSGFSECSNRLKKDAA
jgi:hypothetical protein